MVEGSNVPNLNMNSCNCSYSQKHSSTRGNSVSTFSKLTIEKGQPAYCTLPAMIFLTLELAESKLSGYNFQEIS